MTGARTVRGAQAQRGRGRGRGAFAGAALALGLLTILPVRAGRRDEGLGAAAAWFPAAGALIGAGAGGVLLAAGSALGAGVAGALAAATLVVVTGALHLDGLADCADALGVRGDRERRLAVMREPTIGTFGVAAIVLYLLVLTAAAAGLPRDDALAALVAATALARWSAVLHAAAAAPARPDGLGAAFIVRPTALTVATLSAAAIAVAAVGLDALAAITAAVVVAAGVTLAARRGLGGFTGDTLGASVALTELAALLVLLGLA